MHIPVLLHEVVELLVPQPREIFVDGTLGNGGHALEIIRRIEPNGIFLGLDWNHDAVEYVREKLKSERFTSKIILREGNYAELQKILSQEKISAAHGLFLDLGFSSRELEDSGKGFSFLRDEPLDMRYNPQKK